MYAQSAGSSLLHHHAGPRTTKHTSSSNGNPMATNIRAQRAKGMLAQYINLPPVIVGLSYNGEPFVLPDQMLGTAARRGPSGVGDCGCPA